MINSIQENDTAHTTKQLYAEKIEHMYLLNVKNCYTET